MGIYLNPGKEAYAEAVNSPVFVDKTEMILYINSVVKTEQKYVCVSRPRRFGKSMAANMLCAYYGTCADSYTLFEKTKLGLAENWDQYLEKFNVLFLTMTDFFNDQMSIAESLERLKKRILDELDEEYPGVRYDQSDFLFSMGKFYQHSLKQFVIIIDEWDVVFREKKEDKEGQKNYLDFLRDWLKNKPYVALAYMTGILPIRKYGKHSALNMFDEYSMIQPMQLARFTGFTEEEVQDLCNQYQMDYQDIKNWYDGYQLSDWIPVEKRGLYRERMYSEHNLSVYSPLSVVNAMRNGIIRNYWNKTETYEALAEFISMDFDGLKEAVALLMDGGRLKVDTSSYQNDMTTFYGKDDVLSLLIHLGYLGYESQSGEVFIPNREIQDEFSTSTRTKGWHDIFKAFRASEELLEATWSGDEEKVAEMVEKAHNQAANKTYNDEAALSYGIQLAYYAALKYYTVIPEMDSGKGFADITFLPSPKFPDKPAILVELKYEEKENTAIDQIIRQNYPDRLTHYKGNLLLVGITYQKGLQNTSPEFKHHTCKIIKA